MVCAKKSLEHLWHIIYIVNNFSIVKSTDLLYSEMSPPILPFYAVSLRCIIRESIDDMFMIIIYSNSFFFCSYSFFLLSCVGNYCSLEFKSFVTLLSIGCAFLTFYEKSAAAKVQKELHEKKTLPGVMIFFDCFFVCFNNWCARLSPHFR